MSIEHMLPSGKMFMTPRLQEFADRGDGRRSGGNTVIRTFLLRILSTCSLQGVGVRPQMNLRVDMG